MIQMGWYAHCTFAHTTLDIKKGDFWPMLVHHLAALVLLYLSYTTGYFRTGVSTVFCLDVCDIFLHFAKITRLVDNVRPIPMPILVVIFSCLVGSWIIFRIVLFPAKCIYASSFQGMHYGGWINCDNWFAFNLFLGVIYLLQVYWFYLILSACYKFVRFGIDLDDSRDPTFEKTKKE